MTIVTAPFYTIFDQYLLRPADFYSRPKLYVSICDLITEINKNNEYNFLIIKQHLQCSEEAVNGNI